MKAIATEFGLRSSSGRDRLEIIAAINEFLLKQVERGKETVLIIDEAQDLTEELLEQVRLLSNIEIDDRKLLQIVLLGQPELRDRLNIRACASFASASRCVIISRRSRAPRSANTSSTGSNWPAPRARRYFTQPALWRIFRYSRGIPRLVNAVCDKALLAGFVEQSERINYRMVGRAIRELEGDIHL